MGKENKNLKGKIKLKDNVAKSFILSFFKKKKKKKKKVKENPVTGFVIFILDNQL